MMRTFILLNFFLISSIVNGQVAGCRDKFAANYNPKATVNDGSCMYAPVTVTPTMKFVLPSMLSENSGMIFWKKTNRSGSISVNDGSDWHLDLISTDELPVSTFDLLQGKVNKK
jgi:hypothetical protein